MLAQPITSGTAQTSTSGSSVDFTGIPSWAKRITIMLSGVSVSGTDEINIQLGDSGGLETSSYSGTYWYGASGVNSGALSSGFTILNNAGDGSAVFNGQAIFTLLDSSTNTWVGSGMFGWSNIASNSQFAGSKSLSATLDRISLVPSGSNTFDAGKVNIIYE